MKRAGVIVIALLAACADLRVASIATDAGAGPDAGDDDIVTVLPDGATVVVKKPRDASSDGNSLPLQCDGPCPAETLASGMSQYTALAVDSDNIYFAIESTLTGQVYQCPKTGCAASGPISLGASSPQSLVVAGGQVYWNDFNIGAIRSCAIGGCADQPTTVVSNQPFAQPLVTNGTDLFWTTSGAIRHCPRATCSNDTAETILASGAPGVSLAALQDRVFWPDSSSGIIRYCQIGPNCDPSALAAGTGDLSVADGHLLWIYANDKAVKSCSLSGDCQPIAIGSSTQPSHPIGDGNFVYWHDDLLNELLRCPASGCVSGPEILQHTSTAQPGSQLAIDGQYIYWTTGKGVFRMPKPL